MKSLELVLVLCLISFCFLGFVRPEDVINKDSLIDTTTSFSAAASLRNELNSLGTSSKDPANSLLKDSGSKATPLRRTATGGIIHSLMVFLTILCFIGNFGFMLYSFWISK